MSQSNCSLTLLEEGPVPLLELKGRLQVTDLAELRSALHEVAGRKGIRGLVLDMKAVEIFDSILMGLLISTHRALCSRKLALTLVSLPEHFHEALRISHLNKILKVAESPEEARASLAG
jgi:anti-anti-sigma factor